jgi:maleylpyruvate isomerase
MKLHGFFRSGTSYRVRIALNLKGIEYESIAVSLPKAEHRTENFLNLNPQGLVPILETDEGNFTQSPAIIEYLEERFPQPPLLPQERSSRARVRALAAIIGCDIHPINNLRVLNYIRKEFAQDEGGVTRWISEWLSTGFAAIETELNRSKSSGSYCFGNTPGLADVYLIPQVYSARRFNIDLTPYPRIVAIDKHCNALAAFVRAHPDNQPDAQ